MKDQSDSALELILRLINRKPPPQDRNRQHCGW